MFAFFAFFCLFSQILVEFKKAKKGRKIMPSNDKIKKKTVKKHVGIYFPNSTNYVSVKISKPKIYYINVLLLSGFIGP